MILRSDAAAQRAEERALFPRVSQSERAEFGVKHSNGECCKSKTAPCKWRNARRDNAKPPPPPFSAIDQSCRRYTVY